MPAARRLTAIRVVVGWRERRLDRLLDDEIPEPMDAYPNPTRASQTRPRGGSHRTRQGGFTLIEATLTTIIIATGVLAILAAQQAYTRKNDWAARTSTAVLLANELRELTLTLPRQDPITGLAFVGPEPGENGLLDYDDLDDFAGPVTAGVGEGLTFDPPINALRETIPDLAGWSQTIRVENVLPDNISSTFTQPLGTTDMIRVSVSVRYQAPSSAQPMTITTLTWMVGR